MTKYISHCDRHKTTHYQLTFCKIVCAMEDIYHMILTSSNDECSSDKRKDYVKQDVLEKKIQIFTIINLYVTLNEKGIGKECVKYFECLD